MLLSSVIIVLREALEAAMLIGILSALSRRLTVSVNWIPPALATGIFGAVVYAYNLGNISDLLDGVGQEVVNAGIQIGIFVLIAMLIPGLKARPYQPTSTRRATVIMSAIIALSTIREGSEIVIYIQGSSGSIGQLTPVATGAVIGAGIGISVGVFLYYTLLALSRTQATRLACGILALVGANLLSQATLLLIQADWLPSQHAIWDTTQWLSERSVTGQVLYAIAGYEATPTPLQVASYVTAMIILLGLFAFWPQRNNEPGSAR